MKRVIIIAAAILAIATVGSATVLAQARNAQDLNAVAQYALPPLAVAANQQQVVNEAVLRLQQQGVPVKSAQLISDSRFTPSVIVEFILQSASSNEKGMPDDSVYLNLIGHQVGLALGRGLNVGAFEVTSVNTSGVVLGQVIQVVDSSYVIVPPTSPLNVIDEAAGYAFLNQNLSLASMKLIKMELALDQDGMLGLAFDLQVPDLKTANEDMDDVHYNLKETVSSFNTNQNTPIAYYRLNINTSSGEVLLKYIKDLKTHSENWWMAVGLEGHWYSVPVPAPSGS